MKHYARDNSATHFWIATGCVIFGLGILAAAAFFIRKCKATSVQRHDYTPLRVDNSNSERNRLGDRQARDGALTACRNYLAQSGRYELRNPLPTIGSRTDKHWFIVQDVSLGAERLLTVTPVPPTCPITPTDATRSTVLELFRDLQHPYIHPVLDIEFWETGAAVVTPLSSQGSLRDLIYGCPWDDEYTCKYGGRGEGLPLWQVQRLGRQILEALFFLRERGFPPCFHLHSGNVVLQNGVARVAGLENSLLGLQPRTSLTPDMYGFGYLLYEMTSGYELLTPPSNAHLELELERAPKVTEVLRLIFHQARSPSLEEILCCELFRGVELRELRGAKGTHARPAPEVLDLLDQIYRTPSPAASPASEAAGVQMSPVRRDQMRPLDEKAIFRETEDSCETFIDYIDDDDISDEEITVVLETVDAAVQVCVDVEHVDIVGSNNYNSTSISTGTSNDDCLSNNNNNETYSDYDDDDEITVVADVVADNHVLGEVQESR